ncbi:hypothetical protein, partial [Salmonella enterica]
CNKTEQLKNKKLDVAKSKRTVMYWTVRWSGEQCTGKSAILSLMATDDERRMKKIQGVGKPCGHIKT